MLADVFSVMATPVMRCGSVMKPPVQLMSTMNSSSERSVGAPMTVFWMVSVSVSRSLTNSASTIAAESVVTSRSRPLVFVQPAGGVCSVTAHTVPGGSSGVSGVAQVPVCPDVVIDWMPVNGTLPSGAVHVTSKVKVSSRSIRPVSGPVVVFVIENVLVVFVTTISSPSASMMTVAPVSASNCGSASSSTEQIAPVARLSITSGVLAVMTWSAMT